MHESSFIVVVVVFVCVFGGGSVLCLFFLFETSFPWVISLVEMASLSICNLKCMKGLSFGQ